MKQATVPKSVFLVTLALLTISCAGLTKNPQPQAQKPLLLLDRYELREMRNGVLVSTMLLDKQTGYVWILSSLTDAKPGEQRDIFVPVTVWPQGPLRTAPSRMLESELATGQIQSSAKSEESSKKGDKQ